VSDLIYTTKGDLPIDSLVKTETVVDNDNEYTVATEYRLKDDPTGEVVRRDVHVTLKQGPVLFGEQATL
jgi:hypothetical protein